MRLFINCRLNGPQYSVKKNKMGQFSRQIQWNVTRSVAVASLFYLVYNGGKACLFPFITLYYRDLGLTATQTGIISGSKSLIWYFAAPVWMVMAKR